MNINNITKIQWERLHQEIDETMRCELESNPAGNFSGSLGSICINDWIEVGDSISVRIAVNKSRCNTEYIRETGVEKTAYYFELICTGAEYTEAKEPYNSTPMGRVFCDIVTSNMNVYIIGKKP